MKPETKTCQNCKNQFTIEPEDFEFYAKIKVPPPTFCPECRMIRRFSFRNARSAYIREAHGSDKKVFSSFHPDTPLTIYEESYWLGGQWDPMDYGMEVDFSRPFLEQFRGLLQKVPWSHRYALNSTNSEYCNNVDGLKNCYYCFNSGWSENCYYGVESMWSNDCMDITKVFNCSLCYELIDCYKCYFCAYLSNCVECSNVFFSHDLTNCQDCFGCIGLKHKKYNFFNKQLSKTEYEKAVSAYNIGSFRIVQELVERINGERKKFPVKFIHGKNNISSSGDYLDHCVNTKNTFLSRDLENCAYCQLILFMPSRDSYDIDVAGGELLYEIDEGGGYNIKFCWLAIPKNLKTQQINLKDIQYSANIANSSDLFGCVGVRNKRFCILNKQYTQEEYSKLVPKIIEHMNSMPYTDQKGRIYRYGEFFPPEFSPFSYADTIAQEHFPKTKKDAIDQGFFWRDFVAEKRDISLGPGDLPDGVQDVDNSILEEIIGCEHDGKCVEQCSKAFRIITAELALYRKLNLPLPRLCPNCRFFQRIKIRNPLKLWHRACQCSGQKSSNGVYSNTANHSHGSSPCPNEFETSYAPERPEIVYCEQCYQAEVV